MPTTSSEGVDFDAAFKAAAEAVDPRTNDFGGDGGTCNFDTVVIRTPTSRHPADAYIQTAAKYGFRLDETSDPGYYFVFIDRCAGIADARVRQAKALHAVLERHGLSVTMHYQVD